MIRFGRDVCGNFAEASEKEWLETNGRGGYAMGTVAGTNTRRYHGVFTLPLRPPVDRFQAVNRLEESVMAGGARYEISCQSYPGAVYPQGTKYLDEFRLDPFPIWTYAAGPARLQKTFFLRYGEDTAVVIYELLTGPDVTLQVRPLLTGRNHHHIIKEDNRFEGRLSASRHSLQIPLAGNSLRLTIGSQEAKFFHEAFWYRNQEYAWEERRGLPFREDAFSPGYFEMKLKAGQSAALVMSAADMNPAGAVSWGRVEKLLREKLLAKSLVRGPVTDDLVLASDHFVVARGKGASIIAGYPWFEDWGRDTMISLPGLCLATGRFEEARDILSTYSRYLKDGLLPNRFPEDSPYPDYNTADASLWFIWAVQKYLAATHDLDGIKSMLPSLRSIVDAYQAGTGHGIHMEQDGLISIPEGPLALTWMDVRIDGIAVTPRNGKPVEIQALWYNALQFLAELDIKLQEPSRGYDKLAAVARQSFNEKFWNQDAEYLYDRLAGREKDDRLRPNALFAVSLPYEILAENRFKAVVHTAEREFLTPYGLRSLAPSDPDYHGKYAGGSVERDLRYHQGTAWAWIMGAFLTAYIKAYGSDDASKARVQALLEPYGDHLLQAGLRNISEIFDGDMPHAPGGCPAQAWSVGEILRVLWEENILL